MLTLADDELQELTGYAQPARILAELHRQGFFRARRSPTTGRILLERAHYDAVCQGRDQAAKAPQLHTPRLRSI
jgi:hypothetical protein